MKSGLRLRRIRFHDGRIVEVLRPNKSDDAVIRDELKRALKWGIAKNEDPMSGFALVIWNKDGSSRCTLQSDGKIPSILVPDFVRNRLLAEKIEDWTINTINGE